MNAMIRMPAKTMPITCQVLPKVSPISVMPLVSTSMKPAAEEEERQMAEARRLADEIAHQQQRQRQDQSDHDQVRDRIDALRHVEERPVVGRDGRWRHRVARNWRSMSSKFGGHQAGRRLPVRDRSIARKVMLPPYDPSDSGARPSKTSWSIRKILRPSASDSTVKDSASMPSGFNRAFALRAGPRSYRRTSRAARSSLG